MLLGICVGLSADLTILNFWNEMKWKQIYCRGTGNLEYGQTLHFTFFVSDTIYFKMLCRIELNLRKALNKTVNISLIGLIFAFLYGIIPKLVCRKNLF